MLGSKYRGSRDQIDDMVVAQRFPRPRGCGAEELWDPTEGGELLSLSIPQPSRTGEGGSLPPHCATCCWAGELLPG